MSRPLDEEQEGEAAVRGVLVALLLMAPLWGFAVAWWLLCQPLAWWLVS